MIDDKFYYWSGTPSEELIALFDQYYDLFNEYPDQYIDYWGFIDELSAKQFSFYVRDSINLKIDLISYWEKYGVKRYKKFYKE